MQFLDATTDVAFKKLFGDQRRSDLTISFLNSVLGLKQGERIAQVTIMTGENLPLTMDGKRSFLDINCIDQQGRNYIVEVQKQDEGNFLPRAQFYVGNALARQLPKNKDYKDLLPIVFVGVVVKFELFNEQNFLSHHAVVNLATGKQSHFHAEYHYLELTKFTKLEHELETDAEKWAYLLKHAHELDHVPGMANESSEFVDAFEVLEKGTWNNREFSEYLAEQEFLNKDKNIETTALAKGREEGREEGLAMGEKKKACEIARQMLAKGIDASVVASCTGLTQAEVEGLC